MKPGERGNFGIGYEAPRVGPIGQRKLVPLLMQLIDASRMKTSSAYRDQARALLHETLAKTNWRTGYVLHNIHERRCRYLMSLGYDIPYEFLFDTRPRKPR